MKLNAKAKAWVPPSVQAAKAEEAKDQFPVLGTASSNRVPVAWGAAATPVSVFSPPAHLKETKGTVDEYPKVSTPATRRTESAPVAIRTSSASAAARTNHERKLDTESTERKQKQQPNIGLDQALHTDQDTVTEETRRVWGSLRSKHYGESDLNGEEIQTDTVDQPATRRVWGVAGHVREAPVDFVELERKASLPMEINSKQVNSTPVKGESTLPEPSCFDDHKTPLKPEEVLVGSLHYPHPRNHLSDAQGPQTTIAETVAEFVRASSIGLGTNPVDSAVVVPEPIAITNGGPLQSVDKDKELIKELIDVGGLAIDDDDDDDTVQRDTCSKLNSPETNTANHESMLFAMDDEEPKSVPPAIVDVVAAPSEKKSKTKAVKATDFEIVKEIGVGAFGRVMLIKRKPISPRFGSDTQENDSELFAMKILDKSRVAERKNEKYVMEEREILTRTFHPFIVSLKYAFQTRAKLYLIMEYLSGGELLAKIRREGLLNEKQTMFYAGEIILALEFLHSKNIVHRDLKPENILLDSEGHVRITDFGLARRLQVVVSEGADGDGAPQKEQQEEVLLKSICGTDLYMAPEMLAGKTYGKAVDFWALGCILFEMQTGDPPFDASNRRRLYQLIMTKNPRFPSWMSPSCVKLLKGLLDRNVEKRLGATRNTMFEVGGVRALKSHEFFKTLNWALLEKKALPPPLSMDADPKDTDDKQAANQDDKNDEDLLLDDGVGSEGSVGDFRGFSYIHPQYAFSPKPLHHSPLSSAASLAIRMAPPSSFVATSLFQEQAVVEELHHLHPLPSTPQPLPIL